MTENKRHQFNTSDVESICALIRQLALILLISSLTVLLSIIWPGMAPLMVLVLGVLILFVFLNRASTRLDPQDIDTLKKSYGDKTLEDLRVISGSGPQGDYRPEAVEAAKRELKDRKDGETIQNLIGNSS